VVAFTLAAFAIVLGVLPFLMLDLMTPTTGALVQSLEQGRAAAAQAADAAGTAAALLGP
jgi:hypothetical protein